MFVSVKGRGYDWAVEISNDLVADKNDETAAETAASRKEKIAYQSFHKRPFPYEWKMPSTIMPTSVH
jgi:hypothetical protein